MGVGETGVGEMAPIPTQVVYLLISLASQTFSVPQQGVFLSIDCSQCWYVDTGLNLC